MPKLSSAETPPEKSSACLPVSTIAESGVITRMPLVCMSIVASAFQYGWAPTLIPATTTLISPPSWVNSTMRFRARATQSRFSEQHHAGDALGVPPRRRRDHAGDDGRGVLPLRPVHRHEVTGGVEVVLFEPPVLAREQVGQLVGVKVAAARGAQHLLPVVVKRPQRVGRRRC